MGKREFFKTLRQYIPAKELRKKVREADKFWRSSAIETVKFYRYSFSVEIYKELLKYLYKARCRFDWEFKRQFGHYPPDEKIWGVNKLIVKNGIPVNFL